MRPDDLAGSVNSNDVPCCCSLQFLLRDGKLNLIAHMRSNDLFTGFWYDVFFFTMLQELLARELNVPLGWYQHFAGSFHLYEKDYPAAERILTEDYKKIAMPPLTAPDEVDKVLHYEREIRASTQADPLGAFDVATYWQPFLGTLLFHHFRKTKNKEGM